MKVLAAFIFAIAAAVVVGVLLSREPGYVLVAYGTTRVEFTLFIFVLIYIGALLVGAGIWSLVRRIRGVPGYLRRGRRTRELRRAERSYIVGLVALAEGRMPVAERALDAAANGALTLPALLAAARAADHAGARERRDRYLKQAWERYPKAAPAVLLTQAELDLARGDYERALATLQKLQSGRGAHPLALRDLARVYAALDEHDKLVALLPELVRDGIVPIDELASMSAAAITSVIASGKGQAGAVLRRLPTRLRGLPEVRRAAAQGCAAAGETARAADLLKRNVEQEFDAQSVRAYAGLTDIPAATRLKMIERWLERYGDKPELLTEAGRVSLELKFWGQARSYLEHARHLGPDSATALLAGRIAEQEGRQDDALAVYREALESAPAACVPRAKELATLPRVQTGMEKLGLRDDP